MKKSNCEGSPSLTVAIAPTYLVAQLKETKRLVSFWSVQLPEWKKKFIMLWFCCRPCFPSGEKNHNVMVFFLRLGKWADERLTNPFVSLHCATLCAGYADLVASADKFHKGKSFILEVLLGTHARY